jgi:hypothetical protein
MPTKELSASSAQLVRSIQKRYPSLSRAEARRLGSIVIEEVGKRVASGERLAFLRKNSQGEAELTVLGLEVLRKARRRRR